MSTVGAIRWRYRAANAEGADVNGEIDAATEREAVDALRRRALWVTTLEPVARARNVGAGDTRSAAIVSATSGGRRSITQAITGLLGESLTTELAVTVRAVATLLGAGVPLERALAYAAGPGSRPELQRAFGGLRERVRQGESLAHALQQDAVFPAVFAPTVQAGEASGALDVALATLADHLERGEALRARLRAALAYPALLGVASIAGVVVILLLVVPRFATLIADSGGTLPMSTRALIGVSAVVSRGWWAIALVAVAVAWGARRWLSSPGNRAAWHRTRLALPVVGHFERMRAAAAYTGILSVALRSGVALLPAMRLARGVVRNEELASRLEEAEGRVRDGGRLAPALEGTLPPLSVRLLDAGESGGNLPAMALRAAESADAELQRVATGSVALVEPALILTFGALVGFVALALLQAIYGLNARTL